MEIVSPSEVTREHSAVNKIKSAIIDHGNPFAVEGDRLHNMITHACVPDEFVEQILNANDTGQKMHEDYVTERINGNISRWAKVTKVGNKMFMSGIKTTTIKLRDKTIQALTLGLWVQWPGGPVDLKTYWPPKTYWPGGPVDLKTYWPPKKLTGPYLKTKLARRKTICINLQFAHRHIIKLFRSHPRNIFKI